MMSYNGVLGSVIDAFGMMLTLGPISSDDSKHQLVE